MNPCACKQPKPYTIELEDDSGRVVESCDVCRRCQGTVTDWHPTTEHA